MTPTCLSKVGPITEWRSAILVPFTPPSYNIKYSISVSPQQRENKRSRDELPTDKRQPTSSKKVKLGLISLL